MKLTEQEIRINSTDEIIALVSGRMPRVNEKQLRIMLLSMIITHGADAVNDMYGWYLWAMDHTDRDMDAILVSIFHDIGGRSDKTMCPRTKGYMDTYLTFKSDKP